MFHLRLDVQFYIYNITLLLVCFYNLKWSILMIVHLSILLFSSFIYGYKYHGRTDKLYGWVTNGKFQWSAYCSPRLIRPRWYQKVTIQYFIEDFSERHGGEGKKIYGNYSSCSSIIFLKMSSTESPRNSGGRLSLPLSTIFR